MVPASRAYLACRYLFNEYPLAVSGVDHIPAMHTMVLMLCDGEQVRFFVLMRIRSRSRTDYTLSPWRATGAVEIAADGGEVPELVANVVEQGIPVPRDGSLFGWAYQEIVTALIVIYARYRSGRSCRLWARRSRSGPRSASSGFSGAGSGRTIRQATLFCSIASSRLTPASSFGWTHTRRLARPAASWHRTSRLRKGASSGAVSTWARQPCEQVWRCHR